MHLPFVSSFYPSPQSWEDLTFAEIMEEVQTAKKLVRTLALLYSTETA